MAFITTVEAGCGLRYADTQPASCMAGRKPIKRLPTGCGQRLTCLPISQPARNISRQILAILFMGITAFLPGTHLYYRRWKWRACANPRWTPTIRNTKAADSSGEMANVQLRALTKRFGSHVAVSDVTFDVRDGEFIVLVGPSGCGKTTVLRMIAGLEEITAGELRIDGVLANDLSPAARGIAMVFQSYALYPHMTVYRNMGFGLKLAGVPKAQIDSAVRQAASVLHIEHLLER